MREQALDVARQFEVGLRAGAGAAPAGSWSAVALVGLGGFFALQILPLLVGESRRHE